MGNVTFRGSREGLRVTLAEGEWGGVFQELTEQLARPSAQSFFRGARVLLETPHRALGIAELEDLIELFARYNMELITVAGDGNAQKTLDQLRAPKTPEPAPASAPEPLQPKPATQVAPETPPRPSPYQGEGEGGVAREALVVKRTLRSGQLIKHAGDVVVIGDVNPGAEIVAEGDVIVWGKLRGLVHAGAGGNANAVVSALTLAPMQLRIGPHIARAPDEKRKRDAPAEIARVKDGKIVVEAWGKE